MLYALLSRLFGLALDVFFDRRHLAGAVPREGPVLLVANHQNALADPLVVVRTAGRRVRFLAKEPLFRTPFIRWLVRGMGCLPVFRPKDGHDTSQNDATFRAVHEALRDGAAVCLFPEGISHDLPEVQPLKTGAARMVFGAEDSAGWQLGVRVVPVGLIWRDKTRFRSDLVTLVGEPIRASEFRGDDERASVLALTAAIDDGIRKVTLNLERWEDKPLLELAERIYPLEGENRVLRLMRLADRARELGERAPERLNALRDQAAEFQHLLERLGLSADELDVTRRPTSAALFVLRNLVALLVGLPIALVGAAAYLPAYATVKLVATRAGPRFDVDELAGVKILLGLLVLPLWHVLLTVALVFWLPVAVGVPIAIALPFAGLYAHHFVRRRHAALKSARAFLLLTFVPRARLRLAKERDALKNEIEAVGQLLDAMETST